MVTDIYAHQFFFPTAQLPRRDFICIGLKLDVRAAILPGEHVEHRRLPDLGCLVHRCAGAEQLLDGDEKLIAGRQRVDRTDLHQAFESTFAHIAQIDLRAKVVQAREQPLLASRPENLLDGAVAHVFHGTQPKTHRVTAVAIVLHAEIQLAVIDVRRKHLNPHAARVSHV